MKQVTYTDFQYKRETEFFTKVRPAVQHLHDKYKDFSKRTQRQEQLFFTHLSHSIRIDRLDSVSDLVNKLNDHLNTDFRINLFLYGSPLPSALCTPRYTYNEQNNCKELTIIASQHFLNNLSPDEQISILGHELAHLLYGHVHIPAKAILQSKFDMKDIQDLKSNILKWRICAEISCDIFSFLSCKCDPASFSSAMIKFSSGLTDDTIRRLNQDCLLDLVLKQYDDISEALFDSTLTTHPLTPLRLKIINSIKDLNLVSHYGQSVSEKQIKSYKNELNGVIDEAVRNIYPEIITNRNFRGNDILFELCIAVALSDGHIDPQELEAIQRIIQSSCNVTKKYGEMKGLLTVKEPADIIADILRQAVDQVKNQQYIKTDILNMLRHLITVAASDGIVQKCELDTIHDFSKAFGITKQEIVFIINQLGLA